MPGFGAISGPAPASEFHPYHLRYLFGRVAGDDAAALLAAQADQACELMAAVPGPRETFRYAPGKWSIRELVGHLCDTERVLSYRALVAARGDQTDLPSFDENAYVAASAHDAQPLAELAAQFGLIRRATVALCSTFRTEDWQRTGSTDGNRVSARAWAFAIWAHADLHLATLRDKYLH